MSGKRIGVVLSGCGVHDGAEIHEATLTLYFLDRAGAEILCMAPNVPQRQVVDHLTGQAMNETRNVLTESARIARGKIRDIATVSADELDGVILPGGFGAALNLSSVAIDGPQATVNPHVQALLQALHRAGKPIGAICISPALVSRVFASQGLTLTIGDDAGTAGAIRAMGNRHQESGFGEIVVDEANRVVSTAAYMCAASIAQAGQGIEKLVAKVLDMA